MPGAAKKLVSVSATSTSVTGAREEALERVPCIHYPVQFTDTDKAPVQALINSGSEVNAVHPSFAKQLGLSIRLTDVGAQKIDGTSAIYARESESGHLLGLYYLVSWKGYCDGV